jgi:signal transduction histidine kinase
VLQKRTSSTCVEVSRIVAVPPSLELILIVPPSTGDFERGRWFAGCFCWSTRAERALDGQLDLPFLKTFGHSIMQEVARLDAMSTSQAKTTFLSSLSHELRTPLHGILGSVHLMRNSRLDSFQTSMVNSITICGRTLLETVEHLLDHAERPESTRHYSSTVAHNDSNISITCEKLSTESSPAESSESSKCNVGFVTEEVVETMVIGEAPFNMTLDANDDGDASIDQTSRQAVAKKRSRFIILDIGDYEGLGFRLSASSYGRIVMNLFGNALKFTESGYVHVSVRSENDTENTGFLVLKISDSGIGMSARFLEKAFEPFRKQNQYTAGTGVGLSVVRRILEDIGGRIDVNSRPSIGTDIVLKLPLERLSDEEAHDIKLNPLPVAMAALKGRKACILYAGSDASDPPEQVQHKKTLLHYVEVLAATLSNVLQLDLHHTSAWDGTDDTEVVICPEVSFESLQAIRTSAAKAGRRCPATVLIAMDILEAETLRSDARVTGKESIVESVTQP